MIQTGSYDPVWRRLSPGNAIFQNGGTMKSDLWRAPTNRQGFVGGSDARIIMGADEAALVRLWREKRGEVEPEDLSGNLLVQLGSATEDLNPSWYESNTGRRVG